MTILVAVSNKFENFATQIHEKISPHNWLIEDVKPDIYLLVAFINF